MKHMNYQGLAVLLAVALLALLGASSAATGSPDDGVRGAVEGKDVPDLTMISGGMRLTDYRETSVDVPAGKGHDAPTEAPDDGPTAVIGTPETETPEAEAQQGAETDEASPSPAPGYVLVSTATRTGWLPLPEEGEISYPLKQVMPDGTEAENVIHLTPNSVYMEDSNCEGQDCVQQGEVTLENRKDRILGNMIICLPHQLVLELYTPEELLEMMKQQQAESAG